MANALFGRQSQRPSHAITAKFGRQFEVLRRLGFTCQPSRFERNPQIQFCLLDIKCR